MIIIRNDHDNAGARERHYHFLLREGAYCGTRPRLSFHRDRLLEGETGDDIHFY
jgi:hypothetical protein